MPPMRYQQTDPSIAELRAMRARIEQALEEIERIESGQKRIDHHEYYKTLPPTDQ